MRILARDTDGILFVQEYTYMDYGRINIHALEGLVLASADEDYYCIEGLSQSECEMFITQAYENGRLNLDINGYRLKNINEFPDNDDYEDVIMQHIS